MNAVLFGPHSICIPMVTFSHTGASSKIKTLRSSLGQVRGKNEEAAGSGLDCRQFICLLVHHGSHGGARARVRALHHAVALERPAAVRLEVGRQPGALLQSGLEGHQRRKVPGHHAAPGVRELELGGAEHVQQRQVHVRQRVTEQEPGTQCNFPSLAQFARQLDQLGPTQLASPTT